MIGQTILPFKLDTTRDSITAHAGLALFGEFVIGLKLSGLCRRHLPGPGSAPGRLFLSPSPRPDHFQLPPCPSYAPPQKPIADFGTGLGIDTIKELC